MSHGINDVFVLKTERQALLLILWLPAGILFLVYQIIYESIKGLIINIANKLPTHCQLEKGLSLLQ